MFSNNQLICLNVNYNLHMQRTIENEEKITSDRIRKQRPNHRLFAVDNNNSHKNLVLQVVYIFFSKICFNIARAIFKLAGKIHKALAGAEICE